MDRELLLVQLSSFEAVLHLCEVPEDVIVGHPEMVEQAFFDVGPEGLDAVGGGPAPTSSPARRPMVSIPPISASSPR